MSIANEITRLQGVKSDILTAIADKGVTVPTGSMLDDCPDLIASISGGGGGGANFDFGQSLDAKVMPDGRTWATKNLILVPFPHGAEAPNGDQAGDYIMESGVCIDKTALLFIINNKDVLCPGWNVPTRAEYNALFSACNFSYSTLQNAGFNIRLNGAKQGGSWDGFNQYAFYWTRTSGGIGTYFAYFKPSDPLSVADATWNESLLSVRLIKDL